MEPFLLLPLISLPFLKPGQKQQKLPAQPGQQPQLQMQPQQAGMQMPPSAPPPQQASDHELRIEVYKTILARYQKLIEETESKSIAELKELVRPHDKAIMEAKIAVLDSFHPYVYDDCFLPAAQLAINRLSQIRIVTLPLNFWLSFDEMERLRAADDIDRAIYLCSLLRALDNESARVLISEAKKPYVLFDFKGQSYLIETDSGRMAAYQNAQAAQAAIPSRLLYSFNDRDYEDLGEAEGQ